MKIKLSKPYYKIQLRLLKKDLPGLKRRKFTRFIRRRIPFFMDEYRYTTYAVKRRWGLDVYFFEAGHEQVKPVWLDGTLDELGSVLWLDKMAKDRNFLKKLIKELNGVIQIEKSLVHSIPKRDLKTEEIIRYLYVHLNYWVKYFEIGFLWFAAESIRQVTNEEIKRIWQDDKKELDLFLESIYRPIKPPPSSLEQRDLLKLVPLNGKILKKALANHWKKYRHLSLHNIDDEYFNIQYYLNRIVALKKSLPEFKRAKEIVQEADFEMRRAALLINKAKLPLAIKDRVNFIRWFMYLRTATIDYMMMVNGAYKPVFGYLSKILNLPIDAILHMTFEEIISSLNLGKLAISRDLILERTKNGYAYLIAPHGSYLVTGKEIDKLEELVIGKQNNETVKILKGQGAFPGKIKNIVRVILDRRNASELKNGEILVTTMTSPEFVPAMKIASAIVTNEGGILCHAAIMSRELRKPCIIGTKIATDVLKDGDLVEVDAERGVVKILKKRKDFIV